MYHFEIAEGKKISFENTDFTAKIGEKKEPGSIKSGNKIIWQRQDQTCALLINVIG